MARYPGIEGEARVPYEILLSVMTDVFVGCGMDRGDAAMVGAGLADADLRGIHSHGVMRTPVYAGKLLREGVDPKGRPSIARDSGAVLRVDGGNAMGHVVGTFAMTEAIERARTTGLCAVAIAGSNHCGAMDRYARMAIAADMIGIATTNALPTMSPFGGAERILGINPIAIGMPTAEEPPLVLDISFGATARGKIEVYGQKGETLPEGWALGPDGAPTTDPVAALDGLIAPIGGYKGTGLALMTGLLSCMLSGANFGTALGDFETGPVPGGDGHFMMALNVAAFDDLATVKARTDAALRQLRACRTAPGFDAVLPPGGMEDEIEAEYRRYGIPLNASTLAAIQSVADEVGVDTARLGVSD